MSAKQCDQQSILDFFWLERDLWAAGKHAIAGIDEAGRGPLAGPVVAAAVIFPGEVDLPGINDSKLLTPRTRERLYHQISCQARCVGIGAASVAEIDAFNILQASFLAMKRAVGNLSVKPDYLLVDGNLPLPHCDIQQQAIVRGDRRCFSIAAASIIAKVHRDRLMSEYHEQFPQYQFDRHKGYGTGLHVEAIRRHGRCPLHRQSFHVKALLESGEETGRG